MLHGRTSRFLWILVAPIAIAALAFAACGDDEDGGDGVTPADSETPTVEEIGAVSVLGI